MVCYMYGRRSWRAQDRKVLSQTARIETATFLITMVGPVVVTRSATSGYHFTLVGPVVVTRSATSGYHFTVVGPVVVTRSATSGYHLNFKLVVL